MEGLSIAKEVIISIKDAVDKAENNRETIRSLNRSFQNMLDALEEGYSNEAISDSRFRDACTQLESLVSRFRRVILARTNQNKWKQIWKGDDVEKEIQRISTEVLMMGDVFQIKSHAGIQAQQSDMVRHLMAKLESVHTEVSHLRTELRHRKEERAENQEVEEDVERHWWQREPQPNEERERHSSRTTVHAWKKRMLSPAGRDHPRERRASSPGSPEDFVLIPPDAEDEEANEEGGNFLRPPSPGGGYFDTSNSASFPKSPTPTSTRDDQDIPRLQLPEDIERRNRSQSSAGDLGGGAFSLSRLLHSSRRGKGMEGVRAFDDGESLFEVPSSLTRRRRVSVTESSSEARKERRATRPSLLDDSQHVVDNSPASSYRDEVKQSFEKNKTSTSSPQVDAVGTGNESDQEEVTEMDPYVPGLIRKVRKSKDVEEEDQPRQRENTESTYSSADPCPQSLTQQQPSPPHRSTTPLEPPPEEQPSLLPRSTTPLMPPPENVPAGSFTLTPVVQSPDASMFLDGPATEAALHEGVSLTKSSTESSSAQSDHGPRTSVPEMKISESFSSDRQLSQRPTTSSGQDHRQENEIPRPDLPTVSPSLSVSQEASPIPGFPQSQPNFTPPLITSSPELVTPGERSADAGRGILPPTSPKTTESTNSLAPKRAAEPTLRLERGKSLMPSAAASSSADLLPSSNQNDSQSSLSALDQSENSQGYARTISMPATVDDRPSAPALRSLTDPNALEVLKDEMRAVALPSLPSSSVEIQLRSQAAIRARSDCDGNGKGDANEDDDDDAHTHSQPRTPSDEKDENESMEMGGITVEEKETRKRTDAMAHPPPTLLDILPPVSSSSAPSRVASPTPMTASLNLEIPRTIEQHGEGEIRCPTPPIPVSDSYPVATPISAETTSAVSSSASGQEGPLVSSGPSSQPRIHLHERDSDFSISSMGSSSSHVDSLFSAPVSHGSMNSISSKGTVSSLATTISTGSSKSIKPSPTSAPSPGLERNNKTAPVSAGSGSKTMAVPFFIVNTTPTSTPPIASTISPVPSRVATPSPSAIQLPQAPQNQKMQTQKTSTMSNLTATISSSKPITVKQQQQPPSTGAAATGGSSKPVASFFIANKSSSRPPMSTFSSSSSSASLPIPIPIPKAPPRQELKPSSYSSYTSKSPSGFSTSPTNIGSVGVGINGNGKGNLSKTKNPNGKGKVDDVNDNGATMAIGKRGNGNGGEGKVQTQAVIKYGIGNGNGNGYSRASSSSQDRNRDQQQQQLQISTQEIQQCQCCQNDTVGLEKEKIKKRSSASPSPPLMKQQQNQSSFQPQPQQQQQQQSSTKRIITKKPSPPNSSSSFSSSSPSKQSPQLAEEYTDRLLPKGKELRVYREPSSSTNTATAMFVTKR